MPLRITATTVNEGSTCKIEFILVDYNDNPISVVNITGAAFTLKNKNTGATINSNDGVSPPSNNVISSFNGVGQFSYTLSAEDNVIMGGNRKRTKKAFEEHIFTITINASVSGDSIVLQESIEIKVADLTYKP